MSRYFWWRLLGYFSLQTGGEFRNVYNRPFVSPFRYFVPFIEGLDYEPEPISFHTHEFRPESNLHAHGRSRQMMDVNMSSHRVIALIELGLD